MIISLNVKTNSSISKVERLEDGSFSVYVKSRPEKGEANQEVVSLLSKYFNVDWRNIKIKAGKTGRKKIVEVV